MLADMKGVSDDKLASLMVHAVALQPYGYWLREDRNEFITPIIRRLSVSQDHRREQITELSNAPQSAPSTPQPSLGIDIDGCVESPFFLC